jgi:hypothetical protein
MRSYVLALLVAAACGKPKKADDWSKTPFKTIDASTGGVAFTISMPETWDKRTPPDEGWGPTTGDQFQRPYVTVSNVSLDLATSVESAIATAGAKPEQIVRKESRPDGYHLTEVHDETLIRASVFKKVGSSYLWCTAAQANDAGIASFEATKQALVKVCESLSPK